jgi:hypothetical protein
MLRLFPLLGALWVWSFTPVAAQQVGDPEAGFAVAANACAECHDIMPMEGVSPEPNTLPFEELEAKPFEEIANTTGVTAMDIDLDRLRELEQILPANCNLVFSNRLAIRDALPFADLVVGAVLIPGGKAPKLIERADLALMRAFLEPLADFP